MLRVLAVVMLLVAAGADVHAEAPTDGDTKRAPAGARRLDEQELRRLLLSMEVWRVASSRIDSGFTTVPPPPPLPRGASRIGLVTVGILCLEGIPLDEIRRRAPGLLRALDKAGRAFAVAACAAVHDTADDEVARILDPSKDCADVEKAVVAPLLLEDAAGFRVTELLVERCRWEEDPVWLDSLAKACARGDAEMAGRDFLHLSRRARRALPPTCAEHRIALSTGALLLRAVPSGPEATSSARRRSGEVH